MGILGTITRGLIDDPGPQAQPAATISPKNVSLYAGQATQTFTVTLTGGVQPPVTWNLVGPGSLQVSGDTKSAIYTPPANVSGPVAASLSIQVGSKSDVAAITVSPPPPAQLIVSPKMATVRAGSAQLLSAQLKNTSGTIKWVLQGPGSLTVDVGGQTIYVPPSVAPSSLAATVMALNADETLSDVALLSISASAPVELPLDPPQGGEAEVEEPLPSTRGIATRPAPLAPVVPDSASVSALPSALPLVHGAAVVEGGRPLEAPAGNAAASSAAPLLPPTGMAESD